MEEKSYRIISLKYDLISNQLEGFKVSFGFTISIAGIVFKPRYHNSRCSTSMHYQIGGIVDIIVGYSLMHIPEVIEFLINGLSFHYKRLRDIKTISWKML